MRRKLKQGFCTSTINSHHAIESLWMALLLVRKESDSVDNDTSLDLAAPLKAQKEPVSSKSARENLLLTWNHGKQSVHPQKQRQNASKSLWRNKELAMTTEEKQNSCCFLGDIHKIQQRRSQNVKIGASAMASPEGAYISTTKVCIYQLWWNEYALFCVEYELGKGVKAALRIILMVPLMEQRKKLFVNILQPLRIREKHVVQRRVDLLGWWNKIFCRVLN